MARNSKSNKSEKAGLLKFAGKYRVLAHYDIGTLDWPKNDKGKIDSDFDDYYIPCYKGKGEIRYAGKSETGKDQYMVWVESKTLGGSKLRFLYKGLTGKKSLPKEDPKKGDPRYLETLCQKLNDIGKVWDAELTDGEAVFFFDEDHIEEIFTLLQPGTKGKTIPPLSKKNLPAREELEGVAGVSITVSEEEMGKYREALKVMVANGFPVIRNIHDQAIISGGPLKVYSKNFVEYIINDSKLFKKYNKDRKDKGYEPDPDGEVLRDLYYEEVRVNKGKAYDFYKGMGLFTEYLTYLKNWAPTEK